jgi:hypothetical protein
MRLYPRDGAAAISDAEFGSFEAEDDGGFVVPEELGVRMAAFPNWETEVEKQNRELHEEMERRKDPATLLETVQQLRDFAAAQAAQAGNDDAKPSAAPSRAKRTSSK